MGNIIFIAEVYYCIGNISLLMTTSRTSITLQHVAAQRLREDLARANRHLATCYPLPALNLRQRGTSAGTAWPLQWEIRLNAVLLQENGQAFVDEVIPHELAHLLVYRQFGRVAPHGKEWKWMMEQVLRVPAYRTHHFETKTVNGKTYPYHCLCQAHQLTQRRHNKVMRNASEYRCRHCGERLRFTPGDTLYLVDSIT